MAGIADVETERLAEQDRLDRLKGPGERNRLGQFATPNSLAVAIVGYLLRLRGERSEPWRFLDPAIGSGSFYSALCQVAPPGTVGQASGVEIDPGFAEASARLLGPLGLEVTLGDFTRLEPPAIGGRANLILANPPYVRHHHLPVHEKQRLKNLVQQRLGIEISGLAGLYAHFLLLCDGWLADGGLAAWLIPSEFMDVNYGTAIKGYLTDRVRLHHIHRFDPAVVQFDDALVTSAVVVFEKVAPDEAGTARLSFGGSLEAPKSVEKVPLKELRGGRKWTIYPRPAARPALARPASTTTLGDLFSIRRGLVTGSNGFFVLSRAEAARRGLPEQFLRPILPSPRHLHSPIITADGEGFPDIDRPLVLLDCDRPEGEVRRDHPRLWSYLQEGIALGLDQKYLTSRRTPWYAQERREPPPFLCTYMGRPTGSRPPFRFFWNQSRAVAANVYLLLYPRGSLQQSLISQPELYPAIFSSLQAIHPFHFVAEGRVYGGGLHKMEPGELAELPADAILNCVNQQATTRQMTLVGFGGTGRE